jgi:HEPN domain-containing protein
MKRLTAQWVRKAEADYVIARRISRGKTPLHDGVCLHCQQCAEKYLKALLQELGLVVPRTHRLRDLLTLLAPHFSALRPLRPGLIFLTAFAVDTRYPVRNATKREAQSSLRWAARVRTTCRGLLGIRPRLRRKKSP